MPGPHDRNNALPHDRNNALPHANSLPQDDSKSLPDSQPTGGMVQKRKDHGRNGLDAINIAESRRLGSEGTGNGTRDIRTGRKANAPDTEGIYPENLVGRKQPGTITNGTPTKQASSADGAKPETEKGILVSPGATQPVPRGYFIVERVEMHKNEDSELRFLIKWEGYPESENTWEPFENIKHNTVVKEYIQNKGLELPQQKRRRRPTIKDLPSHAETQSPTVPGSSGRKRGRFERDSSAEFIQNAKEPAKRPRGRPRKVETPVPKSPESVTGGNNKEDEEVATQLQSPSGVKVTPKKQQVETLANSHAVPKKTVRNGPANPSTFVYNLMVEAKRLSPAARSIRLQQLEREKAALVAAGQEDEDDQ